MFRMDLQAEQCCLLLLLCIITLGIAKKWEPEIREITKYSIKILELMIRKAFDIFNSLKTFLTA